MAWQTDRRIRITQHNNFFVLYPLFTKHQTECEKLLILVLKTLLDAAAWELCPPYFYRLLVHVTTERHVQENQLGTASKNTARRFLIWLHIYVPVIIFFLLLIIIITHLHIYLFLEYNLSSSLFLLMYMNNKYEHLNHVVIPSPPPKKNKKNPKKHV